MYAPSTPRGGDKQNQIHVSSHPVLHHKLTLLRDKNTSPKDFRSLTKELTFYLGYEATRPLAVKDKTVETPLAKHVGKTLSQRIALVPILRAGLGMIEPMLELLPMATVHHIGMYRQKDSPLPILYYNKLPIVPDCDFAIILQPLAATGNTLSACVQLMKDWGLAEESIIVMTLLGSKQGIEDTAKEYPGVRFFVGAVDDVVTEDGYILPGVGDVGDRMFCPGKTKHFANGRSVSPNPGSKRKRDA